VRIFFLNIRIRTTSRCTQYFNMAIYLWNMRDVCFRRFFQPCCLFSTWLLIATTLGWRFLAEWGYKFTFFFSILNIFSSNLATRTNLKSTNFLLLVWLISLLTWQSALAPTFATLLYFHFLPNQVVWCFILFYQRQTFFINFTN
jgi:hypothetical protein